MQITLPDDQKLGQKLLQRAQAAGCTNVDEYVLQLVEQDVRQEEVRRPVPDPDTQSAEEWIRDFRAIFASLPPSNPNFDDSRESIYPVR